MKNWKATLSDTNRIDIKQRVGLVAVLLLYVGLPLVGAIIK